jgi:formylmethanofuran dehydrogenase subunit E
MNNIPLNRHTDTLLEDSHSGEQDPKDRKSKMDKLQEHLKQTAKHHEKLCPRQVLGVRMGMLAGEVLGVELPQKDKRLFTFAESDGCGTGGISIATGCSIERRTMRVLDFGKLAATFVDTNTGQATRICPQPNCRDEALHNRPMQEDSWQTMLEAYQTLSYEKLFVVRSVNLIVSLEKIISQPGKRICCALCGEEIVNEREVCRDGETFCRACAGEAYYSSC